MAISPRLTSFQIGYGSSSHVASHHIFSHHGLRGARAPLKISGTTMAVEQASCLSTIRPFIVATINAGIKLAETSLSFTSWSCESQQVGLGKSTNWNPLVPPNFTGFPGRFSTGQTQLCTLRNQPHAEAPPMYVFMQTFHPAMYDSFGFHFRGFTTAALVQLQRDLHEDVDSALRRVRELQVGPHQEYH